MAEWLKKVMEEAERQFNELPEWKRVSAEHAFNSSPKQDEHTSSTIREPYRREDRLL
jgi:hypothetical protein